MSVFKRGGVYWYEFVFKGGRVRESTRQGNKNVATQMEAAHRTALAKGEVGIKDRRKVPTLSEFGPRFTAAIETQCADKPKTVSFYRAKLRYLLKDSILSVCRLDEIDVAEIDAYKQRRLKQPSRRKKPISPASVNRELATLRRLLRLAQEWKIIDRVPRIRLLRGEKGRDFVLSFEDETVYLQSAPPVLRNVATLLLDAGLRVGEALSLSGDDVHLVPANGSRLGYLRIRRGKSKNSKERNIPLTERAAAVLAALGCQEGCLVFRRENGQPLSATTLDQQHSALRTKLGFSLEFVLHSFRHTFGTRLGEAGADAFTIMKLMGHSTVTVSQKYVHPTPESMEKAVAGLAALGEAKKSPNGRVPTISTTVKADDLATEEVTP